MEEKLARLKDLLTKREQINAELAQMLGIEKTPRKALTCSKCGAEGHTARTCQKVVEDATEPR